MKNVIVLKNSELESINNALVELAGNTAEASVAYCISRNLARIESALNVYEKRRMVIISSYAEKDAKGNPKFVTKTEGGQTLRKPVFPTPILIDKDFPTEELKKAEIARIHAEMEEEARDKINELKAEEVEVELYRKIAVWELGRIQGVNGSILFRIDQIIDHEAETEPKKLIKA